MHGRLGVLNRSSFCITCHNRKSQSPLKKRNCSFVCCYKAKPARQVVVFFFLQNFSKFSLVWKLKVRHVSPTGHTEIYRYRERSAGNERGGHRKITCVASVMESRPPLHNYCWSWLSVWHTAVRAWLQQEVLQQQGGGTMHLQVPNGASDLVPSACLEGVGKQFISVCLCL